MYEALPPYALKSIPLGLGVIVFMVFALASVGFAFAVYMIAAIINVAAIVDEQNIAKIAQKTKGEIGRDSYRVRRHSFSRLDCGDSYSARHRWQDEQHGFIRQ